MSLISRPLTGLYNGVSQQPATLRLDSQLEAQVNILGTVVDGLRKRPPLQHVALLTASSWATGAHIHTINRDVTERYIVAITDGAIEVFDQDGTQKTVNSPQGVSYLTAADPTNDFAVVSVGDYSFIVNKTIEVATEVAPGTEPTELSDWYKPDRWSRNGHIPPARFFNVAQGTFQGSVQSFNDLPNPVDPSPPSNGDVYRISSGSLEGENFGTYYVVRTGGVWEETYEPLSGSLRFDEHTMPHALVRESDGTFSFVPFAWTIRQVGDDQTNPPASFTGQTIEDIVYYKNRLGLVSGESVVFSAAGDYGNFWRVTVTDQVDADRVDVSVAANKVANLNFAVPFNNDLMLFSDQTQFSLNVDELLTPTTVSIDAVTNYQMSPTVRPVGIGQDVYFVTETGNFSRVREYFVNEGENQTEAADITAHLPKYVPKGIFDMAGNANEDVLFCISNNVGFKNRIYIYKFHWDESGKVQSSWSYWELDTDDVIINIAVLAEQLYVLVERADGVYLESLNVQSGETAGDLDFQVYLDRQTTITGAFAASVTTFTLPYPVPAGDARDNFKLVKGSDFTGEVGALIDPSTYTWNSNTEIEIPVNESDGEVYIGVNYNASFTFSEQFAKESNGVSITTGRLQIRTITIYFTNTAYFETVVDPYGVGSYAQTEEIVPSQLSAFTGKTVGEASLITGEPNFATGDYSFQVYGSSKDATITIQNDTHVGMEIQSAEWEGFYFNRASS